MRDPYVDFLPHFVSAPVCHAHLLGRDVHVHLELFNEHGTPDGSCRCPNGFAGVLHASPDTKTGHVSLCRMAHNSRAAFKLQRAQYSAAGNRKPGCSRHSGHGPCACRSFAAAFTQQTSWRSPFGLGGASMEPMGGALRLTVPLYENSAYNHCAFMLMTTRMSA